jgi:hypothetical protein
MVLREEFTTFHNFSLVQTRIRDKATDFQVSSPSSHCPAHVCVFFKRSSHNKIKLYILKCAKLELAPVLLQEEL